MQAALDEFSTDTAPDNHLGDHAGNHSGWAELKG